jgi:secreted trypsin-like serine protease
LLNQNNDFIGSCVVIPNDSSNDNSQPTRKVLTAAHKLKALAERDLLKVRVGEYDASGFVTPEVAKHEEYTVTRILKHPQMSNGRLSNDLAILYVDRDINLNHPTVNTACLPSCQEQFSYQFANETGVRCWVAGWGRDGIDGTFQFTQKKVDLPLVEDSKCEATLRRALNQQRAGSGDRFNLHSSEICAGGQIGKDACTGDGGSPLVCQAESGRWTVVGLVAWGVGCASEVPGVYVKLSSFRDWIDYN